MADQWYSQTGDDRAGPMPLSALRERYANGELKSNDPVWTEGWTEWWPASEVPELAGAAPGIPAGDPVPAVGAVGPAVRPSAGQLNYRGAPAGAVTATEATIDALNRTRPWVMLWAVVLFLLTAFAALGVVVMLVMGAVDDDVGFAIGFGLVYVLMGLVYFFAGLYLTRYFAAIGATNRLRRPEDLERAAVAQMRFWRLTGIALLTMLVLYFVILAAVLLFGILA